MVQGRYGTDGQRLFLHFGRNAAIQSEFGNVAQAGYQGVSAAYAIQNGRMVTSLGNTPFEVTVYKMGDKYVAARSNEFGYANYEIVPELKDLLDLGARKK